MSNERRPDERSNQAEFEAQPAEITDAELEPVVGGLKPKPAPVADGDPCLT